MSFNESTNNFSSSLISTVDSLALVKLEEMKESIIHYKKEKTASIENNIIIKHGQFKEIFYPNLEKLLVEIVYLSTPEIKNERINSVYKWFKETTNYFNSVASITYKTSDNLIKHITNTPSIIDDNIEFPLDNLHRSEIFDTRNLDSLLSDFKLKKILRNKVHASNMTSVNNSLLSVKPTKDFSKTTTKPNIRYNQNFDENLQSMNDTPLDYYNVKRKLDIMTGKSKALSNKRHIEEVKSIVNEFGMNRAKYKEDQIKKTEIRLMLKTYSNKNEAKPVQKGKSQLKPPYSHLEINNNKVLINELNILKGLKYKANNNEQKIDIPLHCLKNISSVPVFNFTHLSKETKIPPDLVSTGLNTNAIFKERLTNKNLINVSENPLPNPGRVLYYSISVVNINNIKPKGYSKKEICPPIKTSCDYAKINFPYSSSYLDLRKTMASYKINELSSLKNKLRKKNRYLSKTALSSSWLFPKEDTTANTFLPNQGCGLLPNPVLK